jgi:hypothetical protein
MLIAYALAVAAYQYVDVAQLAGKHYGVDEYAPEEQATMEALRAYWRGEGGALLRGGHLHVVVKLRFPLEHLYTYAAREHGIELHFVSVAEFCGNVPGAMDKATAPTCGQIAFAMRGNPCGRPFRRLGWPVARAEDDVAIYVFQIACEPKSPREWSSPELLEVPLPAR